MADFNKEKRKLIYCISQWTPESKPQELDIDILDLTVLFQIMGYTLEGFERVQPAVEDNGDAASSNEQLSTSRVQLTCSKSGMKSSLTKALKSCHCLNTEDLDKGQLWYSCAPFSSQSTVSSSACSVIPTISKCKASIVGHLIHQAISAIKDKDTCEAETSLTLSQNVLLTRYRSLDTLKAIEESKLLSGSISSEQSWEVDPKVSPSTQASSSLPENITRTSSGLSLGSNKTATLLRHLSTIQEIVTEALEIACLNSISDKKTEKRNISDMKPKVSRPSTPKEAAVPNRRLVPLATKRCGLPTTTFQKVAPRVTSSSSNVGVKSKLKVATKSTGTTSTYKTATKAPCVEKCKITAFSKK